ncbi:hypothetical protein BRIN106911_23265 [Brevibacillus invocatus]
MCNRINTCGSIKEAYANTCIGLESFLELNWPREHVFFLSSHVGRLGYLELLLSAARDVANDPTVMPEEST